MGDLSMYETAFAEHFDTIAGVAHQNSIDKGFWEKRQQNLGAKVALIHSEVSGLLEAMRDNLSHDDIAAECADIIIRVMDLATHLKIPLGGAIILNMHYNATREHLHEKRF